MAELRALQTERKAAVARAEKEARLLVQLAEAEGNNYDPAIDFPPESEPLGFVFSWAEIKRQIERNHRLQRASALALQSRDRKGAVTRNANAATASR
jgi:hypothetical protein